MATIDLVNNTIGGDGLYYPTPDGDPRYIVLADLADITLKQYEALYPISFKYYTYVIAKLKKHQDDKQGKKLNYLLSENFYFISKKLANEFTYKTKQFEGLDSKANAIACVCTLLASWSIGKYTYTFTESVAHQIANSPDFDRFPIKQIVDAFPALSCYLALRIDLDEYLKCMGAFVQLFDNEQGEMSICFALLIANERDNTTTLLEVIVSDGFDFESAKKQSLEILHIYFHALLFICTPEPDVTEQFKESELRRSGKMVRIFKKEKLGLAPPINQRISCVGAMSEKLIEEANERIRQYEIKYKKKPHVRKAHWHLYWTGKRDGERIGIRKFVPMTIINARDI